MLTEDLTYAAKVRRKQSISRYMESKGLPYEMQFIGNLYHALASKGGQCCVMAHTNHEEAGAQYFVGYFATVMEARDIQRAILNAKPRKRFVQCVIVVVGNN